jgi:hypothetical protein
MMRFVSFTASDTITVRDMVPITSPLMSTISLFVGFTDYRKN